MSALSIVTVVIASCISFVFGGLYFGASAEARARQQRSPQQEKIQNLLDRVGVNGVAVVTEDDGETLAVVTCKAGVVQKVHVFRGNAEANAGGAAGLWSCLGATVVQHITGESD